MLFKGDQVMWKRARFCSSSGCVEIRLLAEAVFVRDSKQVLADGSPFPMIQVTPAQWTTFLSEIRGNAPIDSNGAIRREELADGGVIFHSVADGTALTYDAEEIAAFIEGVNAKEFDHTPALV